MAVFVDVGLETSAEVEVGLDTSADVEVEFRRHPPYLLDLAAVFRMVFSAFLVRSPRPALLPCFAWFPARPWFTFCVCQGSDQRLKTRYFRVLRFELAVCCFEVCANC